MVTGVARCANETGEVACVDRYFHGKDACLEQVTEPCVVLFEICLLKEYIRTPTVNGFDIS